MGTNAIWNAKCSTSTCHRNTPYDQRPSIVTGPEPRTAKRWPSCASATGASRKNATAAPSAVRAANSGPDGWTKPSVNHCGTVEAANAVAASAHQPQRAWRCRARAAIRPCGAATSSARIMPAANQEAKAGGRIWSLSRSGNPSSYQGTSAHPRLSTPTPAITGIRHRAAAPRSRASAHHNSGSTI
ncbi:hypothetical protein GCM10022294_20240 [Dietzia aurantiaca]